jgi:amino acid transporter
MKKVFKYIFIGIPNIPLIIFISLYVIYNIFKHTDMVEIYIQEDGSYLTDEIKDHLSKTFPKILFISIGLCFWVYFIFKAIDNY